jgi:hypothetical protein
LAPYLIILTVFTIFIYSSPNDWFGILIIMFIYGIVISNKYFNSNKRIVFTIFVITSIKLLISITNNYYYIIYGAGDDAARFVQDASKIVLSNSPINLITTGSSGFINFLAFIYKYLGISTFTSQNISILVMVLSMIFLLKVSRILNKEKYNVPILILFAIQPATLIYTSITMREPFQILFFTMTTYYVLVMLKTNKFNILFFIKFLISATILGMLHNGLLVFSLLLILIGISSFIPTKLGKFRFLLIGVIALFLIPLLVATLSVLNISTGASDALISGNITSYIEGYRYGGTDVDSSASYHAVFDTTNTITMFFSGFSVFFNYMLAPFPWQLRGPIDLIAISENAIRIFLIVGAFKAYKSISSTEVAYKRMYKYTILLFFTMEYLWALGTINWGTAIRHHLIPFGLIIILGVEWFMKSINKIFSRR